MHNTRSILTRAVAALSYSLFACEAANAQIFEMEFTAVYDGYEYFNFDTNENYTGTTDLTVTGTVVWNSQAISFSNNGVNSHSWDFLSYNAVAVGTLDDGTDVSFTINHGPSNGSGLPIQTVHSPGNGSNLYWRADPDPSNPGLFGGGFDINSLWVQAMPDFTSQLPKVAAEYEGQLRGFDSRLYLFDSGFGDYDFEQASISVVVTETPIFKMDFTIDYDEYEYFNFNTGSSTTGSTDLSVAGSVVWDSGAVSFSNNGVNSHSWDFLSYNADGVGQLDDGTDVGFTINHGPSNGSGLPIQTVHSPGNGSNMYWRADPNPANPLFAGSGFDINSLWVQAMPDYTSQLPKTAAEYVGQLRGFDSRLFYYDSSFDGDWSFRDGAMSVVISKLLLVPSNYPTIQSAIDAASPGDTVLVDPGTYNESISSWDDITILGNGTPDSVIINGGVTMDVGELSGFQVNGTLGHATDLSVVNCIFDGGGVDVENCVIDFVNTRFENCSGGAVVGFLVGFDFDNCIFENNTGGVVRPNDGVATFIGCDFEGNTGVAVRGDNLGFTDCQFINNSDTTGPAAIQSTSEFASCSIVGCDFIGNTSGGLAGAVYMWNDNSGVPVGAVTDCSFENNTAGAGGGALRLSLVPDPAVLVSGTSFCENSPFDIVGAVNLGSGNSFGAMCDCPADVNGDGVVSPTDFSAWINAFNNSLPECDQNGDGSCTPTDFTAWIANYNAGC